MYPKIILRRCDKRRGLMYARSEGARVATGEVVTFLDSHIEVQDRWLEPLLARIKQDPKHVVMPIIDSIEPDSFEYMKGGLDILAFSWSLGQKGVSRPMSDTKPVTSMTHPLHLCVHWRALVGSCRFHSPIGIFLGSVASYLM